MKVINLRRKHRVSLGDGNIEELRIAIATQLNAVEYIPVTLLLLVALEYNNASLWLVHALGITFICGRVIHAAGLINTRFKQRVLGMQMTLYTLVALAIFNIIYLPYNQILIWLK